MNIQWFVTTAPLGGFLKPNKPRIQKITNKPNSINSLYTITVLVINAEFQQTLHTYLPDLIY